VGACKNPKTTLGEGIILPEGDRVWIRVFQNTKAITRGVKTPQPTRATIPTRPSSKKKKKNLTLWQVLPKMYAIMGILGYFQRKPRFGRSRTQKHGQSRWQRPSGKKGQEIFGNPCRTRQIVGHRNEAMSQPMTRVGIYITGTLSRTREKIFSGENL